MINNYLITTGIGEGETALTSFDNALLKSGIANYNLVKVSSILPSNVTLKKELNLAEGAILHTAYSSITANAFNQQIAAAIAVAIPKDTNKVGVIMEFSGYCSKKVAIDSVKMMVEEAMRNRNYEIKEIKVAASESISNKNNFVTVFAGISMW